jgi:hypothetical protein
VAGVQAQVIVVNPTTDLTLCGLKKGPCKKSPYCRWTKSAPKGSKCARATDACNAVQGKQRRKRCNAITTALGGASPLACQCTRSRGKCGSCIPAASQPGPELGAPDPVGPGPQAPACAEKLKSSNLVDQFVWIPDNTNNEWSHHAMGEQGTWLAQLGVSRAIVVPLAPTYQAQNLNSTGCSPGKGGGNVGYPGKVASDFCKTFKKGGCEIYMGVGENQKGPGGLSINGGLSSAQNIQEFVKLFEACMANGDGTDPDTKWDTTLGPMPKVKGIMCIEGSPSDCWPADGLTQFTDAKYSVGVLKSSSGSYLTNPKVASRDPSTFTIAGGEFYNPFLKSNPSKAACNGCCTGTPENGAGTYGKTAKSYGIAMASQAVAIANSDSSGYPNAPAATGFAGYGGASGNGGCSAPSPSTDKVTCPAGSNCLKDLMTEYFSNFDTASLPRVGTDGYQCKFGIWG